MTEYIYLSKELEELEFLKTKQKNIYKKTKHKL